VADWLVAVVAQAQEEEGGPEGGGGGGAPKCTSHTGDKVSHVKRP